MSPSIRKKKSKSLMKSKHAALLAKGIILSFVYDNAYPVDERTPIRSRQNDVKATPKYDPTVHGAELEFAYESDDSFTRKITFSARKKPIISRSPWKSPIRKIVSQTRRERIETSHKKASRYSSAAHHSRGGSLYTLPAVAGTMKASPEPNPFQSLPGLSSQKKQSTSEAVLHKGFSFPAKPEHSGPVTHQPSYQRKAPLLLCPRARTSPDSGSFQQTPLRAAKNERDVASVNFPAGGPTSVLSKVDALSPLSAVVSSKVETPRSASTNRDTIFNSIGKAFKGVFGSPRASLAQHPTRQLIASTPNKDVTAAGRHTPQTNGPQVKKGETPTKGHRRRPTIPVEFRFATEERIQNRQSGIAAVAPPVAAVSKESEASRHGTQAEVSHRASSLKRRRRSLDSNGEEVLDGNTKRRKIEAEALDRLRTQARDSGIALVEAWAKQRQTSNDQSL
ncbi:hypothetical protein NEOLI_004525 [Neolecta irregularis DAH-3]|uniref:Uncharacterized protein n=1 Tax=Neolecta irregularis (strain DAH-3) TaxID=1198029 RepID=A0A1U7LKW0_NEOID|nr:hypothetical protein NEOLI_004525 [Neolecta irregularis DAH-3]|eukprot:OLL23295.1 hypothetical protein NEOLI_004525 [Neolecta irregularis DAH-3]